MSIADALAEGLLVVANDDADPHHLDAAIERLRTRHETQLARTSAPHESGERIEELGARALVVAGGDGTLSAAMHHLRVRDRLSDTVVGLLPLGTGNDFARTLGLPLDPVEAADAISAGRARRLDLMVDDRDHTIVNAVHAGIGADAAQESKRFKDTIGPAAYPLGAALAGASGDVASVRLRVDGHIVFEGDALMIGVANGRTIGGGAPLAPNAEPDDGLLDVIVVTSASLKEKVGFGKDLRTGRHVDRDDVRVFNGRKVEITGDAVRYNADGEVSDPRERAVFALLPASWTILAPPR